MLHTVKFTKHFTAFIAFLFWAKCIKRTPNGELWHSVVFTSDIQRISFKFSIGILHSAPVDEFNWRTYRSNIAPALCGAEIKLKLSRYSDWLRAGRWRVWFSAGADNFSFRHQVQTGSGVHPANCSMGTGGSFPGRKAAGTWSWQLTSI
jgi:hypothetical protein